MSNITRQQFDLILGQFNSQPKEYDYEYSLTTLVFGSQTNLEIKDVIKHLNLYAAEHPLFIQIVDALLNVNFIDEKVKVI